VTFLFWNLNRKPLQHLLAALVKDREVDVLLLAENQIPIADLLLAINRGQGAPFIPARILNEKVSIISRLPEGSIVPRRDYGGVSIQHLTPPVGRDILLVIAHLPSKLYADDDDQSYFCARIARMVETYEHQLGHSRTVIVGDLNMNPFEPGVAAADAFHGVMSRRLAQKLIRTVNGEERKYFYNPMWSRFGDHTLGPPGTYYYPSSGQVTFFWNMFDQVLLRPELLDCFRDEDLEVLTRAGSTNLLTASATPDVDSASDHLPLLFQLHL
jgi:hypothetical protein